MSIGVKEIAPGQEKSQNKRNRKDREITRKGKRESKLFLEAENESVTAFSPSDELSKT